MKISKIKICSERKVIKIEKHFTYMLECCLCLGVSIQFKYFVTVTENEWLVLRVYDAVN